MSSLAVPELDKEYKRHPNHNKKQIALHFQEIVLSPFKVDVWSSRLKCFTSVKILAWSKSRKPLVSWTEISILPRSFITWTIWKTCTSMWMFAWDLDNLPCTLNITSVLMALWKIEVADHNKQESRWGYNRDIMQKEPGQGGEEKEVVKRQEETHHKRTNIFWHGCSKTAIPLSALFTYMEIWTPYFFAVYIGYLVERPTVHPWQFFPCMNIGWEGPL